MRGLSVGAARLFLAVWVSGLGACAAGSSGAEGGTGSGGSTGFGGSSGACATTGCLPLAQNIPSSWIAEIDPPAGSTAAITFDSAELTKPSPMLATESQVTVTATFTAPASALVPSSANAILTIPSPIAGRPPLSFQAPAAASATGVTTASLSVPAWTLGSTATLTLVPLPPADQQNPPYAFSLPVGMAMSVAIATDNFAITGTLQTAVGNVPGTTFVARAFQGGALVSNAPLTQQSDGSFQLVLPSTVLDAGLPLSIELTPQSTTDPWFIATPITLSNPLPPSFSPFPTPILLNSYTSPNYFSVFVQGTGGGAITGAVVQAQTTFQPPSTYGSTQFSRTATTADGTGMTTAGLATLSLLPGTQSSTLDYALAVVPPPSSPFATGCFGISVQGGGASAATASTVQPPITLERRTQLYGTVANGAGGPVANVSVTATPGPDVVPGCTATPAAPASASSGSDGQFGLLLDPGTYQLDYDPPAGSSAPRLTKYGVTAAGYLGALDDMTTLQATGRFQGTVQAPDGTPLPSATVRIYEPRCTGSACSGPDAPAPTLKAQAVTGADGTFQVAVAIPN